MCLGALSSQISETLGRNVVMNVFLHSSSPPLFFFFGDDFFGDDFHRYTIILQVADGFRDRFRCPVNQVPGLDWCILE